MAYKVSCFVKKHPKKIVMTGIVLWYYIHTTQTGTCLWPPILWTQTIRVKGKNFCKSSIKPPLSNKPSLFRGTKLISPPPLPLLFFTNKIMIDCSRGGGGRDEVWGREMMFSQLAKRSPSVVVRDNYSIFPTVNILEARIKADRQRKSEMLKKLKKIISCVFVCLAYPICLSGLKCGGN